MARSRGRPPNNYKAVSNHQMKKSLIVSSMALMASLTIAVAGTSNGGNNTPPDTTGGSKNMGTKTFKYTSSYTDPVFGLVTCTGVHQDKQSWGQTQDSFTCTAQPAGTPLQNLVPSQTFTVGWYSDYYALNSGPLVLALTFNGVVSADGFSFTAVATYAK
jgi:hypothetical protein